MNTNNAQQRTVVAVVPVHTAQLSDAEWQTVAHNREVLSDVKMVLLVPERVDVSDFPPCVANCAVQRVPDRWMTPGSLHGYNEMMLSAEFYALFDAYDYMLVCQPDAWLFRNEVMAWCRRGFDYVGAPWWRKGIWSLPLLHCFFPKRRKLYGKVGNGGLSLRRIDAFVHVCRTEQRRITYYLSQTHHTFGEDVFWAVEPKGFHYPTMDEALMFSFDTRPERCYEATGHTLPMGCHGWLKPQRTDFWKPFIIKS